MLTHPTADFNWIILLILLGLTMLKELRSSLDLSLPEIIIQQLRTGYKILQVMSHDFQSDPPLIVFSMPKAGTSTIWLTIRDACPRRKIYKVHKLSEKGIDLALKKRKSHKNPKLFGIDSLSEVVRKKINRASNIQLKVITSTREPIAQAASRLFQGISNQQPQLIDDFGKVKVDDAVSFLKDKFENFDEAYQPELNWYDIVWFDNELKPVFGIDIYEKPYDFEAGFSIIRNEKAEVLVIRAEDLNKSLNSALSSFLNLQQPLEIKKTNIADEKQFRDAYQYVKKNLIVPRKTCEKIYSSKYARHFYTDAERERLIDYWSNSRN